MINVICINAEQWSNPGVTKTVTRSGQEEVCHNSSDNGR